MILAPAAPAHAPAMALTHAECFDQGWPANEIAACLTAPGGYGLIVAEAADLAQVSGFLLARAMAGEAEVLTLAVAPRHRRQGVARALLDASIGVARRLGARALYLEAASDNLAALALYEHVGFERAGLRRGYYARAGQRPGDAFVLRHDLNTGPA